MPRQPAYLVDRATRSVVVVCLQCRTWRAAAPTVLAAWHEAADHEARVHPGQEFAHHRYTEHVRKATRRAG